MNTEKPRHLLISNTDLSQSVFKIETGQPIAVKWKTLGAEDPLTKGEYDYRSRRL